MFDHMIESRGFRVRGRALWPVPVAAAAHAFVIAGLLVGSVLVLQQMGEPDLRIWTTILEIPLPPPPIAAAPLGDGGSGSGQRASRPVATPPPAAAPREIVQPRQVAAQIPDLPVSAPRSGGGEGDGGGSPNGAPWGIPGGIGDGPPGGIPAPAEGGFPIASAPVAPIPLSPEMTAPVLLFKVQPAYPEIARRARLPGRVILQAVINEKGEVEDIQVLSATSPLFEGPASDAVRKWKYKPALQDARPVKIYFTVVVEFRLT